MIRSGMKVALQKFTGHASGEADDRIESQSALLAFYDEDWYRAHNADVVAAGVSPRQHFLRHGYRERRETHPFFQANHYWASNPDIHQSGLSPLQHYLRYGFKEDRAPNMGVDPAFFRRHAPGSAGLAEAADAFFVRASAARDHNTPFFDGRWYAEKYGIPAETPPLIHFLQKGMKAGYVGHPLFDEAAYLRTNPDIAGAVARGELASGYEHFLRFGWKELELGQLRGLPVIINGRQFDIDMRAYANDNADVQMFVARREYPSAIAHLFCVGWKEIASGMRAPYSRERIVKTLFQVDGADNRAKQEHICLFAHYDGDQLVDEYVVEYVRALYNLGIDVVFITATNNRAQWRKIEPFCRKIIIKSDFGRDFGSWYVGLKALGFDYFTEYKYLILANDSIYFPVSDPRLLLEQMKAKNFDFWGLTDSRQDGLYHIQSFFMGFNKAARDVLLPIFIKRYEETPLQSKRWQISEFEYGMTTLALEHDLSCGAYCPADDIREDILRQPFLDAWRKYVQFGLEEVNFTHQMWDLLIKHYNCPFVKLELLRDNPVKVKNIDTYPGVVDRTWLDPGVIENHLARVKEGVSERQSDPADASVAPEPVQLYVKRVVDGRATLKPSRLVLLAHFDPDGWIDDHIVRQVKALHDASSTVVIITHSAESPEELDRVAPYVWKFIIKNGVGRDFGSWALAIRELQTVLPQFETVIWMNDSTYFPLFDPTEMFDEMKRRGADFWGVVDSFNIRWHVMSWFWAFDRKLIEAGWFDWFLREYNATYEKWEQIRNYEMRLGHLLRAQGFKVDTYIRAEDMKKFILEKQAEHPLAQVAARGDFTMTHVFWDLLITEFRCPALKVELVRDNPLGLDISSLLKLVGEKTEFDVGLIERHIRRVKCGHLFPEFRRRESSALVEVEAVR